MAGVDLSTQTYRRFVDLVYRAAGISLGDAKMELVRSRLLKRLRALNLATFEAYYDYVSANGGRREEIVQMIDCISTNKTDFFREKQHFDFLVETGLPAIFKRAEASGSRRVRIWSAGCSSGEEPYTLAMVLRDNLPPGPAWDARILATDISTRMLQSAQTGHYEEAKVQPVPPKMRQESFTRERTEKGVFYRVRPEVKAMVTFRRLNLMRETFPFKGLFDVIFCRNVMIYFDKKTQEALVNRYHRYLQVGGYLFIGHSESLTGLATPFQFVKPTIYTKNR